MNDNGVTAKAFYGVTITVVCALVTLGYWALESHAGTVHSGAATARELEYLERKIDRIEGKVDQIIDYLIQ